MRYRDQHRRSHLMSSAYNPFSGFVSSVCAAHPRGRKGSAPASQPGASFRRWLITLILTAIKRWKITWRLGSGAVTHDTD